MAKILDIITVPDPNLRRKSAEISGQEVESEEYRTLFADMALTMKKKDGIGLAAPQIGRQVRVVVINSKEGPIVMINPRIDKRSWAKEWGEEGCLSVPKVFGQVKRHKKISCWYLDSLNTPRNFEAQGLMARVIQHELDHLDGILFVDKAKGIFKTD